MDSKGLKTLIMFIKNELIKVGQTCIKKMIYNIINMKGECYESAPCNDFNKRFIIYK